MSPSQVLVERRRQNRDDPELKEYLGMMANALAQANKQYNELYFPGDDRVVGPPIDADWWHDPDLRSAMINRRVDETIERIDNLLAEYNLWKSSRR